MFFALIACVGLHWILKYGEILDTLRNSAKRSNPIVAKVLECSMCLGFWVGVFIGLFGLVFDHNFMYLLMPFASSGSCWLLDSIINAVQSLELYLDKKDPREG